MRRIISPTRRPGNHKPASNREPLRRQHGRPDSSRQTVLFLRQRMGSHRAAHRHRHHRSQRRPSRPTSCSNFRWAGRIRSPDQRYPAAPQLVPFYQKMFSLYGNTGGTPSPCSVARSMWAEVAPAIRQRWKRLRQSPKRLALQRRPRTSADRSHRLQHQSERHCLVSLSGRHRPAGRLHRPDQPAIQCDFSAAALFFRRGIHARFFAASGELLQSGLFLVRKPVRTRATFRKHSPRSRSCCKAAARTRLSLPSEDWTTPGFRAGAPRASSSTTTSPGAMARTNCASEPIPESSA